MTYRKNTRLGFELFIKLLPTGKILIVTKENVNGHDRCSIGYSWIKSDWDLIYNNYSHSNAREFNDAYNLVKENI